MDRTDTLIMAFSFLFLIVIITIIILGARTIIEQTQEKEDLYNEWCPRLNATSIISHGIYYCVRDTEGIVTFYKLVPIDKDFKLIINEGPTA